MKKNGHGASSTQLLGNGESSKKQTTGVVVNGSSNQISSFSSASPTSSVSSQSSSTPQSSFPLSPSSASFHLPHHQTSSASLSQFPFPFLNHTLLQQAAVAAAAAAAAATASQHHSPDHNLVKPNARKLLRSDEDSETSQHSGNKKLKSSSHLLDSMMIKSETACGITTKKKKTNSLDKCLSLSMNLPPFSNTCSHQSPTATSSFSPRSSTTSSACSSTSSSPACSPVPVAVARSRTSSATTNNI